LKGTKEWNEYCKSGKKPEDIPSHPDGTYKKEFKGYGDWLGTGTVADRDKVFRSFTKAREFVRELKLKNSAEWKQYCNSGKRPSNIPGAPNDVYKNKGWYGIPDWLGNGNLSNTRRPPRMTYDECSLFAQKNNIASQTEWENFSKSGKRPSNIPGHPRDVYKKEWVSWGKFLGTDRVANQLIQYRSFTEAREFARSLGLKNIHKWNDYCKSGKKPGDIPAAPWNTYKKQKTKRAIRHNTTP